MADKPIKTFRPMLIRPCVPDAVSKCGGCGATLKTELDEMLHNHQPRKAITIDPLPFRPSDY